jgi:predicted dehydrogenase
MNDPIRLGIVGANPDRGWARDAHLAAIRALPRLRIAAVSARSQEGADRAASAFGAARGYADSLAMARADDVDVVVVTVRVPEHRAVVLAALAAGKHVCCEWPLGRDLAEASEMAAAVPNGIHAVIGAQGLSAPAVREAVRLVRSGAIGKPLILRAFGSAAAWGGIEAPFATDRGQAYLQDKASGATLETIGGGHMLAAIDALVGAYVEIDARTTIFVPEIPLDDGSGAIPRSCADHMLVLGRHESGCVSTFEMIGGRPAHRTALFELIGSDGWLRISGTVPGTYQIPPLTLEASVPFAVPVPVAPHLSGPPANLAEAWSRFADEIDGAPRTLPDFAFARRITAVLAAIDRASATGERQRV